MKQLFLSNLRNTLLSTFTLISVVFSSAVFSAQVSQAQIAQFKSMPAAQQQMLAKQMGVDMSTINGLINGGTSSAQSSNNNAPITAPVQRVETTTAEPNEFTEITTQKKLKAFGYNIFSNAPSTFNPTNDIPIPEGYILGVGDQISLQIFGKENNQYSLDVSREGQVIIPDLGPLQVAGLSFNEVKRLLVRQIKKRIIGVDAVVSLSQLKSIRVFVLGAAYKPGPYTISSLSSITHALFTAGGVSDIGSLRNIQLKRSGKLIQTFDLYDLLIKGDSSKDVLLQSGDVVFITTKGVTASIAGEVLRPAIYEIAQGETIQNLLSMAGGILPNAHKEQASIERYNNSLRTVLNIDLTNAKDLVTKVKDGDYLNVMEKSLQYGDSLTLLGAVTRPGKYQWTEGLKITDIIPNIETSLLNHADFTYSLLVREINIARDVEVYQFSLANALAQPNGDDNLTIQPRDKIVVFSRVESVLAEKVTLDNLAFTQDDLLLKRRQQAKTDYNEAAFWRKYNASSKMAKVSEDNTADLFDKSVNSLANNESDKRLSVAEKSLFSRQKLLGPINNQLISQSDAGQPLQIVEISGQVQFPGTYPLPKNGTVKDLVVAAGGVIESAYLQRADLTRSLVNVDEGNYQNSALTNTEAYKENLHINLLHALNDSPTDNIALKSKDRINVHKIPAWSENQTIQLSGEFLFPGVYAFQRGETLGELIERAGGLTKYAHIPASVFTRESLKSLEAKNIAKVAEHLRVDLASKSLAENTSVSYVESQQLIADISRLAPVGRLVIELDKVLADNDYKIALESGDSLFIPSLKNSVNVIGQVQVTSSHIYQKQLEAFDYIAASGGIKKRADEGRIYVVAANGSIKLLNNSSWFSSAEASIKPGDTIVVPLNSDYTSNIDLWATATQLLYSSAVAVAAINGL
ncbi:MAG: SLBB domain-containing protein, partial [Thalassotalea sp.]